MHPWDRFKIQNSGVRMKNNTLFRTGSIEQPLQRPYVQSFYFSIRRVNHTESAGND